MTPTLYEWAGGAAAFRTLFDRFYERVRADEVYWSASPEFNAVVASQRMVRTSG